MPFNAIEVARQIEESRGGVQALAREREQAIKLALRVYEAAGETEWERRVQDATLRRWVGVPAGPLSDSPRLPLARPQYGIVATDSSFVPPDKHRGSYSYLINVGRVMVRYGEEQAAEIDNIPNHYLLTDEDDDEAMSDRLLQVRCALRELEELLAWSETYRPEAALVDGSLMQLPLVLSREEAVREVVGRYYGVLQGFERIGVPVIGYISQPASQMVMRGVRMLACERQKPCENRPDDDCTCRPLWSVSDDDLFHHLLPTGQRSAIFEPRFSYMSSEALPPGFDEMLFAYIGTDHEAARIEFPGWVAEQGLLDRALSIILHQCRLGGGYPNALTRAHQFAALHFADRESYFFLLDKAGLLDRPSEKALGKWSVGQAI